MDCSKCIHHQCSGCFWIDSEEVFAGECAIDVDDEGKPTEYIISEDEDEGEDVDDEGYCQN
jgi:hypothetical protein